MQDTASVQLKTQLTAKSATKNSTKTGTTKSAVTDASMADPFLQMIMNLLTQNDSTALGTASDTTADSGLQTTNLLSLVQNLGTTDGTETSSTSALMQLLAGSSNSLPALESLMSDSSDSGKNLFAELLQTLNTQSSGSVQSALTGVTDTSSLLQQLAGLTQSGTSSALDSAQLATLLDSQKANAAQTQTLSTDPVSASTLADLSALKSVESTGTDTKSGDTDSGILSQQQSYSRTIAKAKELLTKSPDDTDDTESTDKLGSLSASKTASPFELRLQAAAKSENTSLVQQLETGLKENLSAGKSEFTIKLKPESLGEITVKLTEEAGKSILTITTASAATAKLLNSDLDALKAAMAPLNVRVNEAVTQTASAQQGSSQQFDMAGQQFAGQQQQQQFAQQYAARQNGNHYGASYRSVASQDEAYTAAAVSGTAARNVSSGLDAYV